VSETYWLIGSEGGKLANHKVAQDAQGQMNTTYGVSPGGFCHKGAVWIRKYGEIGETKGAE
jgi:hypothetical protein